MSRIAIFCLLASLLATSAFTAAVAGGIGLAYAQPSDYYLAGQGFGFALGSNIGSIQGVNARDSGLELDYTSNYQPPTEEQICIVYQDASNSQDVCDTSQQGVYDFFQGFATGYQTGYSWGYSAGYLLDVHFPSQAQPEEQFTTQPGIGDEGGSSSENKIYETCIAQGQPESICEYAAGGGPSDIPLLCEPPKVGGLPAFAPPQGCE